MLNMRDRERKVLIADDIFYNRLNNRMYMHITVLKMKIVNPENRVPESNFVFNLK
jgi:hypothetical protein